MIQVDVGYGAGLQTGDVGVVYFEVAAGRELQTVQVGTGRVVDVAEFSSAVRVDRSAVVERGQLVRFEIPERRLALPAEQRQRGGRRAGPGTIFFVAPDVDPCLNMRTFPARFAEPLDCLAPGTRVEVLERMLGWKKARIANGRAGWLAEAFLTSRRGAVSRPAPVPRSTVTKQLRDLPDLDLMRKRLDETRAALSRSEAARTTLERRLEEAQAQPAKKQTKTGRSRPSEAAASLRARLQQSGEMIDSVRGYRTRLQAALAEAEASRQALTRRLFEETVADLQLELRETAGDLRRSTEERTALVGRLDRAKGELAAIGTRLAEAEHGKEALREERDRLATELDALRTGAAGARAEEETAFGRQIQSFEEQSRDLRDQLAAKDDAVEELTRELEDLRRLGRESAELIARQEAENLELRSQVDSLEETSEELEGRLREKDGAVEGLTRQLDELRQAGRASTELHAENDLLSAELAALETRLGAAHAERDELDSELGARQRKIERLTAQIQAVSVTAEASAEVAAERDELRASFDDHSELLEAAELERAKLREERDQLAIELEALRAEMLEERRALEADGTELRERLTLLERDSSSLRQELARREQKIAELGSQIDAFRETGRESLEASTEKDERLAELRSSLDELERQRQAAEQRASAAGSRTTELELRLRRARTLIAELERRLQQQPPAPDRERRPSVEAPITLAEVSAREPKPEAPPAAADRKADTRSTVRGRPGAATRVNRITWRKEGEGIAILIYFDGDVTAADCEVSRVRTGQPRDVLKIRGIRKAFSPSTLEIPDKLVQRIRTGLHWNADVSELHVVADLSRADVGVRSVSIRSKMLVVTIS